MSNASSSSPTPATRVKFPAAGVRRDLPGNLRRFIAGIRLVMLMLCAVLLVSDPIQVSDMAVGLLCAYAFAASAALWAESHHRPAAATWVLCVVDAAWATLMLHATEGADAMFILTLVQPTLVASVAYGVRQGMALAVAAAAMVVVDPIGLLFNPPFQPMAHALKGLAVLALVPAAAMLSRAMNVIHRQRQLLLRLETNFDPRRGLDAAAAHLLPLLREDLGARLVTMVLTGPAASGAWVCTADSATTRADESTLTSLAATSATLPASFTQWKHTDVRRLLRQAWTRRPGARRPMQPDPAAALANVAQRWSVPRVVALPLVHREQLRGHLLIGTTARGPTAEQVDALQHATPELLRMLETATLVDQLQEETTALERARIGRDLHDSAIQPYLGLKFAVESMALGMSDDDPLRSDMQHLVALVQGEIESLRELISGMRHGMLQGENTLLPAIQRQAQRFEKLFGLQIHVTAPAHLPSSRNLATALFHMVNESLNNVRKHTAARQVWLTLNQNRTSLVMKVRDDAATVSRRATPPFQPRSLCERADQWGGQVTVSFPDGLNTEVVITIPVDPEGTPHERPPGDHD